MESSTQSLPERPRAPGYGVPSPEATMTTSLEFRKGILADYPDVYTLEVLLVLEALAPLNERRRVRMAARTARRQQRADAHERIAFLDPAALIPGTQITVADARAGNFDGAVIPPDLQRQWIQGTGPATKPRSDVRSGIRNAAYALLSGADGWMFDGEDALGQVDTMSLDNHRNLKLAIAQDPVFLHVAEEVAGEMNAWATGFLGHPIVTDWRQQLDFTTVIYRCRGLHLDDRHIRLHGQGFSASLADMVTFVVNNQERLRAAGRSLVLYLPKTQTAEDAALWNAMILALEGHLGLPVGTIKCYVLVEQLEECFQLMEIRAALAPHFVGFNTGRWDYINSVSDALAWDPDFVNPNIQVITMTYGYMRTYEDPVRRAMNTPDRNGRCALWQGGMEPNIPVGSAAGAAVTAALFARLLEEEYAKLRQAGNRDVHDDSKGTTLPIARAIVQTYVQSVTKAPWYVDLLNLNLGVASLAEAERRIVRYLTAFKKDGTRLTENLDF